jgi:predicted phosphodiesterase
MKFALASDVHLEFGELEIKNTENADVLVLAGDICVAADLGDRDSFNVMGEHTRSNKFHKFFVDCCTEFTHVVYVMGNHEHYNGDYAITAMKLKDKLGYLKNLHILDKEVFVLDDVTFIGGTLWTDMNNEDETTLHAMSGMMNDFRCVDNSDRKVSYKTPVFKYDANGEVVRDEKSSPVIERMEFHTRSARFSPEDAVVDHKQMMTFIQTVVEGKGDQKFVVVGHHAPSKKSTHPRYAHEKVMNGGYSTNLDEYILDHPQIKVWVHGHTHEDFDYKIGDTRIVCNPRGYINYEYRADSWMLKYIEV